MATTSLGVFLVVISFSSIIASYGNDIHVVFTNDEVAAATAMYESAPPRSAVIQLTNDYPTKFLNYENLTELDVASFSEGAKSRFVSDPSFWFQRWLSEGEFSEGFVLITRSQRAEVDRKGNLPAGSAVGILEDLRASPNFEILFDTQDGSLFRMRNS
jgi:hypothetical protein